MRVLVVLSGHPQLYRCGEWVGLRQLAEDAADLAHFTFVVPKGSVVAGGSLPNTTIYRSTADSGYFYFRDIGSIASVNDGRMVFDVVIVMTAEMATGVDLQINPRGFGKSKFETPIVIWHGMFWALKDERWKYACTQYWNLFQSDKGERHYQKFLRETFRPSLVKRLMDKSEWITYGGRLEQMVGREKPPKHEKLTIMYGARFNAVHRPDVAIAVIEGAYKMGIDFDLVITTQSSDIPEPYYSKIKAMGGRVIAPCDKEMFQNQVMMAHIALTTGHAEAPSNPPEHLCLGTAVLCQDSQWSEFVELRDLSHKYPWVFSSVDEGIRMLVTMCRDVPSLYENIGDSEVVEDMVRTLDVHKNHRRIVEWAKTLSPPYQANASGRGMPGTRARIAMQLASAGGSASLSEMEKIAKFSGTNIHDEQIGRWVTRKFIHDLLVATPGVVDTISGPEPVYRMDMDRFREWCSENGLSFPGPSEVKMVVGVPNV